MGCAASKLDNEDTVRRCKERRRLMKDAVFARHHLAAAHADYCRSLRVTGVALSDFAAGEPLLIVSPSTPSVLLNQSHPHYSSFLKSPSSLSTSSTTHLPKRPPPIKTASSVLHPPPPPPPAEFSPTIASSKLPHILSASSVKSGTHHNNNAIEKVRIKKGPKLPHILSDSSVSSSTPKSFDFLGETAYVGIPNSNYASTPSQASSVWNWDNFYPPPSPPGSDFFHPSSKNDAAFSDHHDYRDFPRHAHQGQNRHLGGEEEGERESEREEVHCSEWGDHYSTTSSDSDDGNKEEEEEDIDGDGDDERETRSEISELRTRSHFGSSSVRSEPVGPPPPLKKVEEKSEDGASSRSWKNNGREVCGSEEMRIVVRHKDLQEIVGSLREYFDKAAAAGDQVSEMLETGRAQLDRSFRQLKSMIILLFASSYTLLLIKFRIGSF